MPFKSNKQREWLRINKPDVYERYQRDTSKPAPTGRSAPRRTVRKAPSRPVVRRSPYDQ